MAAGFWPMSSSASSTAMWASPRAPPPPSARAKLFVIARPPRAQTPRPYRERAHQRRHGGGVLARCRAVAHAADDALEDRRQAEEIVGEIDRQMRARVEPGTRHIGLHIGRAR